MALTHTVVKGDTLWGIAENYGPSIAGNSTQERVNTLVKLNNIANPDYIVVGQVLKLSGSAVTKSTSKKYEVEIHQFGLVSGSDRSVFVSWYWDHEGLGSQTDYFRVIWYYMTGVDDNNRTPIWFIGKDEEQSYNAGHGMYNVYDAPSNAYKVYVKILPVSKKYKSNGKDTSYWTGSWASTSSYFFSNNPPETPAVPTTTIDKYVLTSTVNNIDPHATGIEFQFVYTDANGKNGPSKTVKGTIYNQQATVQLTGVAGATYRVRCRAWNRLNDYGDWCEYSSPIEMIPSAPGSISTLKALTETSIQIEWPAVPTAKNYVVEYTTDKSYFDTATSEVKSTTIEATVHQAQITGLESGDEYFFRVKATNDAGDSGWTEIKSIIIGKDPAAPTTWSSTTTAIVGEDLTLYWIHNAEDGSSQTYAEIEMYVDDVKYTEVVKNSTDEEEKDKTSFFKVNTSQYDEGVKIKWRVRTSGITNTFGDWSIQRTIDIYAKPVLALNVTDADEDTIETLHQFPFYVYGLAGPNTQAPIGYQLSIVSNEIYETVDNIGNVKMVNAGEQVYSKYFDITDPLLVEFSPANIDLENGIEYTVMCTVSMNSGLTAEDTHIFRVSWEDEQYSPNAEIGFDTDTISTYIRPYCGYYPENYYKVTYANGVYTITNEIVEGVNLDLTDDPDPAYVTDDGMNIYAYNGGYVVKRQSNVLNLIEGVTLSVYRREFDGTFTELATGLKNTDNVFITDPHPALDFARYRIVAITDATGAVSYYDLPGYPIGESAIIIQWDEEWSMFETSGEDLLAQPPWSGSLLKLPYNIDVSENYTVDSTLIKYIGRKHPVGYYGTAIATNATWNLVVPKTDEETIYGLRRLAVWPGNVYVREPSGTGYWANIAVSFSQKHRDLTIPVTLTITRVEGGV